ncbi:hypothetical protein LEP48_05970 [Isoptericola sp. NEAU-Y5]|uniref:Lipopolysaccharide biosynthesis protein n=1 Tax=Isoptericola luteus TaxID=2879484 RepID=A0ABS7ZEL9_9MICO|nr:tyrosine-protein kinase domain-containing protein [Isoptericola sp. NEAU-Y5]MCA5892902.1 hypothetical protein [Isoptericola sp. NEAU-Y5]
MTVRDFLQVVWAGKYYVLATTLLVVVGAWLYLDRQDTVYQSTAVVQINSAQSVIGADTSQAASVDVDPDFVTSEEVAAAAAEELGYAGNPAVLALGVTPEYDTDAQTMSVIADAGSPQGAQAIAGAFARSYVDHLPTVRDQQIAELDERRDALRKQLATVQKQLKGDEDDPLAAAERDTIITQYQAVSALRSTMQSIVEPGTLLSAANPAVALGLSRASVLAMAVLLGLVAGVGAAFARRGLDFHVRSAEEAAAVGGVNVLAELYGVKAAAKKAGSSGRLPITSRAASPFTESIRELRTATRVSLGHEPHRVVVVTSADPAAPRSFIAANLAASWALSGLRTVAFSADMRQAELDSWLPAPEGWSGVGTELRPTTVPNLELQPVPDVMMDPADFLATEVVRKMVGRLRERADMLVIDAPPVLAAADATILGGYADGVVVLATAGRTDRYVLGEAIQRLHINDVPIAGLALSGVRGDRRTQYATRYGDGERGAVVGDVKDGRDAADPAGQPAKGSDGAPGSGTAGTAGTADTAVTGGSGAPRGLRRAARPASTR